MWIDDEEHRARSIIATGATARWLELPSESRLRGFGVSTCATCDGFFKDKADGGGRRRRLGDGGGLFLARMASKVTIVHRRDQFRASRIMADRALANERIGGALNAEVVEVLGDERWRACACATRHERGPGHPGRRDVRGHRPRPGHGALPGQLELDEAGYIVTDGTRTSVEGVYAAGDHVQDTIYRQAVTAAGSGCMAAMDAEALAPRPRGPRAAEHARSPRGALASRKGRVTMAEGLLEILEDNFQGAVLENEEAGADRLLGRVVRSLSYDRPGGAADLLEPPRPWWSGS